MKINNYCQEDETEKLNTFLENLLSEQESLGEEFSSVLSDNILDLYQS